MEDRDRQKLLELLVDQRVATLAVLIEGTPYASLVPFALDLASGTALIHASALARHSSGLAEGAPYALLVHETDSHPDTNPAQLARVSLEGTVRPLARNQADYELAKERYLSRFPKSAITFGLGDFTLFALRIDQARFVAGFGKTFDLAAEDLAAAIERDRA